MTSSSLLARLRPPAAPVGVRWDTDAMTVTPSNVTSSLPVFVPQAEARALLAAVAKEAFAVSIAPATAVGPVMCTQGCVMMRKKAESGSSRPVSGVLLTSDAPEALDAFVREHAGRRRRYFICMHVISMHPDLRSAARVVGATILPFQTARCWLASNDDFVFTMLLFRVKGMRNVLFRFPVSPTLCVI